MTEVSTILMELTLKNCINIACKIKEELRDSQAPPSISMERKPSMSTRIYYLK